jgi:hypothetical protein
MDVAVSKNGLGSKSLHQVEVGVITLRHVVEAVKITPIIELPAFMAHARFVPRLIKGIRFFVLNKPSTCVRALPTWTRCLERVKSQADSVFVRFATRERTWCPERN